MEQIVQDLKDQISSLEKEIDEKNHRIKELEDWISNIAYDLKHL